MPTPRLVLAGVAACLLLAGCGGDGTASNVGKHATVSSANVMAEVSSAQVAAHSSHVSVKTEVAGRKVSVDGDVAIAEPAQSSRAAMELTVGGSPVHVVMVENFLYANLGSLTKNKFAKLDLTDKSNPLVAQYGRLVEQLEPSRHIDQLQNSVKSMEKKGEPIEIDGVQAQPYALSDVDLPAFGPVPDKVDYTMYLGPDNLPRRIVTDAFGSSTRIDFTRWGEPVEVSAPPTDQVIDFADLKQPAAS